MRVVAIVGTRRPEPWMRAAVMALVRGLPAETVVVTGGAYGVDWIAERLAREQGLAVEVFYPDYDAHGDRAPLVRNRRIAERCTELHAFPAFGSRGTWHAVGEARKLGRAVVVHREGE